MATTVRSLRIAIAAGDVAGMEGALAALRGSMVEARVMLRLENEVRLARAVVFLHPVRG